MYAKVKMTATDLNGHRLDKVRLKAYALGNMGPDKHLRLKINEMYALWHEQYGKDIYIFINYPTLKSNGTPDALARKNKKGSPWAKSGRQ